MSIKWNSLSFSRLQTELKNRDLNTKGKRSELIAMLVKYEKEQEDKLLAEEDMEVEKVAVKEDKNKKQAPAAVKQVKTVAKKPTPVAVKEVKTVDKKQTPTAVEKKSAPVAIKEVKTVEKKQTPTAVEKKQTPTAVEKKPAPVVVKKGDDKTQAADTNGKGSDVAGIDEGDAPADYSKTATGFVLSLEDDTKIVLPTKETLKYDILGHDLPRSVVVFPITIEDVMSEFFREYIDGCVHFKIVFYERRCSNKKSTNGYIQFVWDSIEEAEEQAECLSEVREGLEALHMKDKKTIGAVADLPGESVIKEDVMKRLIYIGNLPQEVNEQALEALFPDATRLLVIRNEDGLLKGYALAEMENDDACERATKMYMNVEFGGKNLVVLRAWQKIPKGLLDCHAREELLETVHNCNGEIKKNPTQKQLKRIDHDLNQAKQRLTKDVELRKEMGLSVPPDVARFNQKEEQKKMEEDLKKLRKANKNAAPPKKQIPPLNTPTYPANFMGRRAHQEAGWEPVKSDGNQGFRGNAGGFGSNQPPQHLTEALGMIDNIRDMLETEATSGPVGFHGASYNDGVGDRGRLNAGNPRGGSNLINFGSRNQNEDNIMGSRRGGLIPRSLLGDGMDSYDGVAGGHLMRHEESSLGSGGNLGGLRSGGLGGRFGASTGGLGGRIPLPPSDEFSVGSGETRSGNLGDRFGASTGGGLGGRMSAHDKFSLGSGSNMGGLRSVNLGGKFGGRTGGGLSGRIPDNDEFSLGSSGHLAGRFGASAGALDDGITDLGRRENTSLLGRGGLRSGFGSNLLIRSGSAGGNLGGRNSGGMGFDDDADLSYNTVRSGGLRGNPGGEGLLSSFGRKFHEIGRKFQEDTSSSGLTTGYRHLMDNDNTYGMGSEEDAVSSFRSSRGGRAGAAPRSLMENMGNSTRFVGSLLDAQTTSTSSTALRGNMRESLLGAPSRSNTYGGNLMGMKRPVEDDVGGFGSAKRGPGNFMNQRRW